MARSLPTVVALLRRHHRRRQAVMAEARRPIAVVVAVAAARRIAVAHRQAVRPTVAVAHHRVAHPIVVAVRRRARVVDHAPIRVVVATREADNFLTYKMQSYEENPFCSGVGSCFGSGCASAKYFGTGL